MVECPSCARLQEPRLICRDCKSPIAADVSLFAVFDLPRRLQIDTAALEKAYHDLGRQLHPDRFSAAPVRVREASLRATALLTRAYRTLRDPIKRAAYWLELSGAKLADQKQQVSPQMADLVFDVQEELSELKASEADGSGPEESRNLVRRREIEVAGLIEQVAAELGETFASLDRDEELPSAEDISRLKVLLADNAYLGTLLRDIHRALDSRRAA
jgi:molecular chaperone HscB